MKYMTARVPQVRVLWHCWPIATLAISLSEGCPWFALVASVMTRLCSLCIHCCQMSSSCSFGILRVQDGMHKGSWWQSATSFVWAGLELSQNHSSTFPEAICKSKKLACVAFLQFFQRTGEESRFRTVSRPLLGADPEWHCGLLLTFTQSRPLRVMGLI